MRSPADDTRFDPLAAAPLLAMHAAALAIFWTGVSPVAIAVGPRSSCCAPSV